jgi:hypothetical protein
MLVQYLLKTAQKNVGSTFLNVVPTFSENVKENIGPENVDCWQYFLKKNVSQHFFNWLKMLNELY